MRAHSHADGCTSIDGDIWINLRVVSDRDAIANHRIGSNPDAVADCRIGSYHRVLIERYFLSNPRTASDSRARANTGLTSPLRIKLWQKRKQRVVRIGYYDSGRSIARRIGEI